MAMASSLAAVGDLTRCPLSPIPQHPGVYRSTRREERNAPADVANVPRIAQRDVALDNTRWGMTASTGVKKNACLTP